MHSVQLAIWTVATLVAVALVFDFMNGFHDAANSIATVVSTGVLKPQQAVAFAAMFNVIAYFIFHLKVAETVGRGTIDPAIVDHYVVFGALVGAALAKSGWGALNVDGLLKTIAFIFVSPLLGFVLGSFFMLNVSWLYFRTPPSKVDRRYRRLQLVSAGLYSLGHGGNDAQKTIGIIWMLLIATGYASASADAPPIWVIGGCYLSMGLGTLFGGWRIVRTMGQKITKLKPVGGFCAETGGALTLFFASWLGIPVSTTHTITGAIVGVGATRKLSAVRWGVAGNIVWAWILTIPASAVLAGAGWWFGHRFL
ncbi:inorganic phosphate transporter [Paraburkholderia humisilvae]|uniref:Low-affinity inorganic phosphate transporter 1 n=1 Tax=Paraburkholderia humisilvae TaxID=627669 RepID=A0A6J5DZF7_9BURK|nr:inorganic phosphate transporter [Paraburkholderia humisilvae]CAB3758356.1 hypothetical protein LMG29542_03300 [Paraburkholderia humisilvae]